MRHTPFGYRIESGKAIIDDKAAAQIRMLFESYLSGASLEAAAHKAGIECLHTGIGRMLQNARYLGNEYYPAIIDPDTFAAAQEERNKRAENLGRIREPKEKAEVSFSTAFRIKKSSRQFDDPFQQAEYAYSLIENEVNDSGNEKECHTAPAKEPCRR